MQTLLKKLKLAVEIEETGKEWEFKFDDENYWSPGLNLQSTVAGENTIRIKPWTLPPPPPGRQYHRTDGWTEEMLPEGWRPFLLKECGEGEFYSFGKWSRIGMNSMSIPLKASDFHCRTLRPLPPEPEWGPLGPKDVPPMSIGCQDVDQPNEWSMIVDVSSSGITIMLQEQAKFVEWSALQEDGWLILRPGGQWEPAKKLKGGEK